MASPLALKSWQISNTCFEFTLQYRFPIYMDPKSGTLSVNKSISKMRRLGLFLAIMLLFTFLQLLFVLDPLQLSQHIKIGIEIKIMYFITIVLCNVVLLLGAGLYCNSKIFARFYNTLVGFESDLRRIYLLNFRLSEDTLSYIQLIREGKQYCLNVRTAINLFLTFFVFFLKKYMPF